MPVSQKLRTCPKGHQFHKTSDCPTCPVCEAERKPVNGFLSILAAPARRALENNGITTLESLSSFSEGDLLELHGMGKSSLPKLRKVLNENGPKFREGGNRKK